MYVISNNSSLRIASDKFHSCHSFETSEERYKNYSSYLSLIPMSGSHFYCGFYCVQDQNIQTRSPHPIKDEMDNGKIKGLVSQTFHQSLHFTLTLLPLLSLVQNLLRKVTCLSQALFLFLLVVMTVSNFKEHLGQKTETLMKLTNLHISCWLKKRAQNITLGSLYKSHSYYLVGCHLSGKLELIQIELLQRYIFWDCRPGYLKYITYFPTDSCFHMAQY